MLARGLVRKFAGTSLRCEFLILLVKFSAACFKDSGVVSIDNDSLSSEPCGIYSYRATSRKENFFKEIVDIFYCVAILFQFCFIKG